MGTTPPNEPPWRAGGLPLEPAGTREELQRMFEAAGYERLAWWIDRRTPLLSGLVPAEAITDPATAARARLAARRFLDRLPEPVPENVRVLAARLVDPQGYVLEMDFEWSGGTGTRRIDVRPYLWGPVFDRLREDQVAFAKFYVALDTVCWPGGPDLAPELLYDGSWPAEGD